MTSKISDPVQALADALHQRQIIAAELPDLRARARQAAASYQELHDLRERHEGDALVGTISESKLAKSRTRFDDAQQEHRRAAAALRQTEERLAQLDADVARLTPAAQTAEIAGFETYHEELARQLADKLTEAAAINELLRENFRAAETRFPSTVRRHPTPALSYPPAAGLPDLSWHELRHNPHAQHGGRLGAWRQRVRAFLDRAAPEVQRPHKSQSHLPVQDARSGGLDVVSAMVQRQNGGY